MQAVRKLCISPERPAPAIEAACDISGVMCQQCSHDTGNRA
jgi:hypothetical protein